MMNDDSKLTNPWFEHDENANIDGKILKMFRDFRKLAKEMTKEQLESFAAVGAYGIFWRLVEFLHSNILSVDDADIIADDLRVETKFVEMILNEFNLFYVENGYYVSDRIIKNLERRKEKSTKNKQAINVRWIMHAFNKAYTEIFNEEPVLLPYEIEALKKYAGKIPDLKDKLRDIIYTLKFIKFDTKFEFKQRANWLLAKNNLARILNGEFGTLKHCPTKTEVKEEERKKNEARQAHNKLSEIEIKIEACTERQEAIERIKEFYSTNNLVIRGNHAYVVRSVRAAMEKFNISDTEIITLYSELTKENEE